MPGIYDPGFIPFLLRAKHSTYAGGGGQVASSRPQSHDLAYHEDPYTYLDTYLGGYSFIGEEAVWENDSPLWGMNYYGTMLTGKDFAAGEIPDGFGDFLKLCLRHVPAEAPYRGPAHFEQDGYIYTCCWAGDLVCYHGEESIALAGQTIYRLYFHGGIVR